MNYSGPNHPPAVRAASIESDALLLRQQGYDYEEVARQLQLKYKFQVSPGMANKAVKRALKRVRENSAETAKEVIGLEDGRLDTLFMFAMNKVRQGNLDAIGQALKIMERRAKLHGLDAAIKAQVNHTAGELNFADMPAEKLAELERLLLAAASGSGHLDSDDVNLEDIPNYG